MSRSASTILLTGFGPFPGTPENLTARFVPQLAERASRRYRVHRIVAETFPTEWSAAPQRLAELYQELRPQLALHFGVSDRAAGFVIETTAVNACASSIDAAGCLPATNVIDETGHQTSPTGLPAAEIAARLTALHIPVSLSDDAGHYLCNTIFYRALQHASAAPGRRTMAGFIHLPARFKDASAKDAGGGQVFDLTMAMRGAMEIIRVCLGRPSPQ